MAGPKGREKKPLPLYIPGCSTAPNVTYGAFSESENPFPYIQHQNAFEKLRGYFCCGF